MQYVSSTQITLNHPSHELQLIRFPAAIVDLSMSTATAALTKSLYKSQPQLVNKNTILEKWPEHQYQVFAMVNANGLSLIQSAELIIILMAVLQDKTIAPIPR